MQRHLTQQLLAAVAMLQSLFSAPPYSRDIFDFLTLAIMDDADLDCLQETPAPKGMDAGHQPNHPTTVEPSNSQRRRQYP